MKAKPIELSQHKIQFQLYLWYNFFILILTIIMFFIDRSIFRALIVFNPILFVSIISIFSIISIGFLIYKDQFFIYKAVKISERLKPITMSICLAFIMIFIDILSPFSKEINILFPNSLLYYLIIAFVIDILFHTIFFGILYKLFKKLHKRMPKMNSFKISSLFISIIEPIIQIFLLSSSKQPFFIGLYIVIHIFTINYIQMKLFYNTDFVTMNLFRLTYYTIWHIIWGMIRLSLIFN